MYFSISSANDHNPLPQETIQSISHTAFNYAPVICLPRFITRKKSSEERLLSLYRHIKRAVAPESLRIPWLPDLTVLEHVDERS